MVSFARVLWLSVGIGIVGCASVGDRGGVSEQPVAGERAELGAEHETASERRVLAPGWSSVALGERRVTTTQPAVASSSAVFSNVAPVRVQPTTKPVAQTGSRRTLAPAGDVFANKVAAARLPRLKLEGETSLREVMQFLASSTGLNFYVDPEAEDGFAGELDLVVDRPLGLTSAMDLITDFAGDDVAWTLRHGVVYVTTPEKARGRPRTTVYDISDLLYAPPSYVGREMNVAPSGGLLLADEDIEERGGIVDESRIIELIRETIAPGTWDDGKSSITVRGGKLIVTHD